jgi:hypothetical protein
MTIVLICFAGFLLAFLLELSARAYLRLSDRCYVWPPYEDIELTLNAGLDNLPSKVRFRVNSFGERGSEPPPVENTFRILAAGGSSVECYFLDQETAWPALVEKRLESGESLAKLQARSVHVANIGKSGCTSFSLAFALAKDTTAAAEV